MDALIARGDSVVVIDDFSTGKNRPPIGVKLIEASILDKKFINEIEKEIESSDQVIHLAAAVGVFTIVEKPLESLKRNINGTETILDFCDKFKKPIFIASTSEVYGKNNNVPLNEESDRVLGSTLLSRWSYSEAKAIDESMAYFYHKERNLPVRIVRFFNTVGPRQVGSYGMVIPRFVGAALEGKPIKVFGDGSQIRCFAHVSDVIRAVLLVLDSETSVGHIFNIGNSQQISILDLAKLIITITKSNSIIEFVSYSDAYSEGFEDMQRRVPDISKIKQVLGWTPEIDLDQIIKDIAAFNSK